VIWSIQPRSSLFQIELAQLSRLDLGFCGVPHIRVAVAETAVVKAKGIFNGESLAIIRGRLTTEAPAEPFLRSGQLVRVLKDWSPSFEGFFVYYSGRRQVPTGLRALRSP
jgi:DNA-binding transcriptional LysR family regulator